MLPVLMMTLTFSRFLTGNHPDAPGPRSAGRDAMATPFPRIAASLSRTTARSRAQWDHQTQQRFPGDVVLARISICLARGLQRTVGRLAPARERPDSSLGGRPVDVLDRDVQSRIVLPSILPAWSRDEGPPRPRLFIRSAGRGKLFDLPSASDREDRYT